MSGMNDLGYVAATAFFFGLSLLLVKAFGKL
jgi:hypothetical protein